MPTTPGMQEIAGRPATGNYQELQEHQQEQECQQQPGCKQQQ